MRHAATTINLPAFGKPAIAVLFLALALQVGPGARADESPQHIDEVIELRAGMHRIRAEVARTEAQRERGLMFRQSLPLNTGMLFIFERPRTYCFWMRNTPLPLSIAFVGDDGTVVNIADMEPQSEDSHCANAPVRFALEMEQGWFAAKGIAAGSRLSADTLFTP